MLFARTKTRTNPVFYADRLDHRLAHDPDRLEAMRTQPRNLDLLVWNVFASLDTDHERAFLAGQLQPLGGSRVRAPLSLSLWTGVHREPVLRPSGAYRRWRQRSGEVDDPGGYLEPIEVPVRLESPDVLVLVDVTLDAVPQGAHGRDRFVELIDAGSQHAHAVGKHLVVSCVYRSGTRAAAETSSRVAELRRDEVRAAALPWHADPPPVELRELAWQRLLRIWDQGRDGLDLSRQPVKRFLEHAAELGLR